MFNLSRAQVADANDLLAAIEKTAVVIDFDLDGTILRTNGTFFERYDYSPAELRSLNQATLREEAGRDDVFWAELAAGNARNGTLRLRRKGGGHARLEAAFYPVRNRRGKLVKITALAREDAGLRRQIAEMEGKLAAISRFQAVLEFSPEGMVLDANPNALTLLGFERSEVVGRHHRELVEPALAASEEYRAFWQKLGRGEFVAGEFRRIAKGGRLVHMQASYNPVHDADGKVLKIVKFATDVTDRVESVGAIGKGLGRLAEGDLGQRIETRFDAALEPVRVDFNQSLATLEGALVEVGEAAATIDAAVAELGTCSDHLAERTERQAASVEETAAAITEMSGNVKISATNAEQAGNVVARAKAEAERSGQIVAKAVASMSAIEQSSQKITSIIGVIDEIAFQTNLLALNAGVEAARAGAAGKGFAVVAQEVRELAQRSAMAAKEIKTLINASSAQVADGVELVGETGDALAAIVGEVETIDEKVQAIVAAARQQAEGLAEISKAVGSIDLGTQQNASMAEEATAACHHLSVETRRLSELLGRFRLSDAERAPARPFAANDGATRRRGPVAVASSQATAIGAKTSPARNLIRDVADAFASPGA
ncbi:methyl-accepting chemotaxis protein [Jiella sonneratiae]|uniref:PAS domain-containing methyl-accepting chemotaxis protein n=1 Tax=Jiella sonneratiae TaxID=2816856 RepID=A0ABS3J107_9HYPH|nr:PAS domain-containing methyl-accepting chemotaxis protein [Jiella sonneratiae]MBO0902663.1 PAS domain-containing methyl-accepting chemotaxis protein [Jiella sonneratiae]